MEDDIFLPEWLPDLIDVNGAPDEVFELLYRQFCLDFFDAPCSFQSARIRCDNRIQAGERYEEIFWHLVTRTEYRSGVRLLDTRRAERLAWCAAVISNTKESEVTVWNYLEGNGKCRTYLWLRDFDYVVILEKRGRHYWLVTAFHVDQRKREDLEGRYRRRIAQEE